jgi:hypothetical protein
MCLLKSIGDHVVASQSYETGGEALKRVDLDFAMPRGVNVLRAGVLVALSSQIFNLGGLLCIL